MRKRGVTAYPYPYPVRAANGPVLRAWHTIHQLSILILRWGPMRSARCSQRSPSSWEGGVAEAHCCVSLWGLSGASHCLWMMTLTLFFLLPFCSGHCYYQMVVTPVMDQLLPESPGPRIPHTVTLVSIPACSDGKRGLSVSIDQHGSSEHPHTVRVRE